MSGNIWHGDGSFAGYIVLGFRENNRSQFIQEEKYEFQKIMESSYISGTFSDDDNVIGINVNVILGVIAD